MDSPATAAILTRLADGPAEASVLAAVAAVSQPTVSRALRALERDGRVVRVLGSTRGARYGLARRIGSIGSSWPLYRIDEAGAPHELGVLHAIERDRYALIGGRDRMRGIAEGLPYYLQDLRPSGFLGRSIPAQHVDLDLPARVQDWNDAHVLTYLVRRGVEGVGDLILGRDALDRYLRHDDGAPVVEERARAQRYPELAARAMAGAPAGSSAAGEHPKFAARVGATAVLVKFSPVRDSPTGRRWADLLLAEGIAADHLQSNGIAAVESVVHEFADRVFLETRRFDRVGADGRRGVASLSSVDAEFVGGLENTWAGACARLADAGLLSHDDAERAALLDAFGNLIANTDRHFGNLSFFDDRRSPFELAPAYDMLPMLFAPADGQLVERDYVPAGPTARTLRVWARARDLALDYWRRLEDEARLTADFRERARACRATLEQFRARGWS
jgi:DNA-binding transcriptional ArsR family regulator